MQPSIDAFLHSLEGRNASPQTVRAYRIDLTQFLLILQETNGTIDRPSQISRADIYEYLSELAHRGLTGTSRARKFAALEAYFRFLVTTDVLEHAPTDGIQRPKKEHKGRVFLMPGEYRQLLLSAAGNPRDYAILQVFLQTGLRVSELAALKLDGITMEAKLLTLDAAKGQETRSIELEKTVLQAIKTYLAVRPKSYHRELFLNQYEQPFSERGIYRIVVKYVERAGLSKHVSCHILRHTFATAKARANVPVRQIQAWLGHKSLETTQLYIHLVKEDSRRLMESTSL